MNRQETEWRERRQQFVSEQYTAMKSAHRIVERYFAGDGTPIDFDKLSGRAVNALRGAGLYYWEDLDDIRGSITSIRNAGSQTIAEIKAAKAQQTENPELSLDNGND